MNILITCDRLDCLGGLEEHVINKVTYLLNKGHNVHLDCNAISLYYADKITHKNLTLSSPWSENWSNVLIDINNFIPDIVHAHPFSAISRGYTVSRHFKIPLIYTIHGEYVYKMPFANQTKKIILVNNKLVEKYKTCDYTIIPNGIDTDKFVNTNYVKHDIKKTVITIISRLQDNKEMPIIEFIKACKNFSKYITIRIIGDGSHFDRISRLTGPEQGFECNFELVGSSTNIVEEINKADLVCGCDRVALEALCCSKPVFYLGQGHMKDLIEYKNHEKYIFTNEGKKTYTEDGLAHRILNIIKYKLSVENTLVAKIRNEYNLEKQMKQIEEIYIQSIN